MWHSAPPVLPGRMLCDARHVRVDLLAAAIQVLIVFSLLTIFHLFFRKGIFLQFELFSPKIRFLYKK
jgi:hypothetical protein